MECLWSVVILQIIVPTIITAFYIILNDFYENIKCRKFTVMGGLRG